MPSIAMLAAWSAPLLLLLPPSRGPTASSSPQSSLDGRDATGRIADGGVNRGGAGGDSPVRGTLFLPAASCGDVGSAAPVAAPARVCNDSVSRLDTRGARGVAPLAAPDGACACLLPLALSLDACRLLGCLPEPARELAGLLPAGLLPDCDVA